MSRIFQGTARVAAQEQIAKGIFSLWLECPDISAQACPGQFVSLYCADRSRLLPRPISICQIGEGRIRLVYRIAGAGTKEFSQLKEGSRIDVLGPLGNGYPLPDGSAKVIPGAQEEGKAGLTAEKTPKRTASDTPRSTEIFLIGGGIGIPPLVALAQALPGKKTAVLGFRDELFLTQEFIQAGCAMTIATEDGSTGTKGNVLDAIRKNDLHPGTIYACGPTPMLRALKQYAQEQEAECYLSLEQRMACGIGACLACVCPSPQTDEHSRVKNKRVCAEGPVFRAQDIVL